MPLSSQQLEAFVCVAKHRNFSLAARSLGITQSALSQRILNLEAELELTLFIRERSALKLTQTGDELLRYCQSKDALESEFLNRVKGKSDHDGLKGQLTLAAFSSYSRSKLIPQITVFNQKHSQVLFHLLTREVRDLPGLLSSGEADFVFTSEKLDRLEIECRPVGLEENVLIEAKSGRAPKDVFIDHDEFDTTTRDFWALQSNSPKDYRRIFFDEIYSLIDAVEAGLGRAVVPKHLIEDNKKIQIISKLKALRIPIYLIYYKQPYYTETQKAFLKEFFPRG